MAIGLIPIGIICLHMQIVFVSYGLIHIIRQNQQESWMQNNLHPWKNCIGHKSYWWEGSLMTAKRA